MKILDYRFLAIFVAFSLSVLADNPGDTEEAETVVAESSMADKVLNLLLPAQTETLKTSL